MHHYRAGNKSMFKKKKARQNSLDPNSIICTKGHPRSASLKNKTKNRMEKFPREYIFLIKISYIKPNNQRSNSRLCERFLEEIFIFLKKLNIFKRQWCIKSNNNIEIMNSHRLS